MKFNTSYAPGPSKAEPLCPKKLNDYLKNKNTNELEVIGEIPFYEEIQSHYESTKLSNKLQRYAMGDDTALGMPTNTYLDTTNIPTNLAQVLGTKQVAEDTFNKLPRELKQLFNGSFTEFIKCVENGTYEQRLVDFANRRGGSEPGKTTEGSGAPAKDSGGNQ